ncbi:MULTISPECIES: LuxR C-terminal-related transcriptional regulator [unclassified Myroides]|uniref:LuxR C-terminal-related transcriptional regulator n=1 Tax=unclassified Myroides TaxID=2642485 RepID=UPI003D2F6E00
MKIWITLFIGIWSVMVVGKTPETLGLEKEIAALSRKEEYEVAIEKLQWIVLDFTSSNAVKAEAFFLKHEIYSKIGIYTEAESNLKWFLQHAVKDTQRAEISEGRYQLFAAILRYKQYDNQKAIAAIEAIRAYSSAYSSTEYALYLFLEGLYKIEVEQSYSSALIDLEGSIELLKQEKSDYLPMVYKEQLRLYILLKNHEKAVESYERGLKYAKELKVTTEALELYRLLANYYQTIGLNRESLALSDSVLVTGTTYNSSHLGSKLYFVEKEVLNHSQTVEQQKSKTITNILLGSVSIVCLLLGLSFVSYRKNRKKKLLIELENRELKTNYSSLKQEQKQEYIKEQEKDENPILTERQATILSLVKEGKTNKEIAVLLCISENTVKYHLKIIYSLLKVKGRSDLI